MIQLSSHISTHVLRSGAVALASLLTALACADASDDAPEDDESPETGEAADPEPRGPEEEGGDAGTTSESEEPAPENGNGNGVHITGSFNGESLQIDCEPPTDLTIGTQFLYQTPGDLFELWQFRCRNEEGDIQVWFDLSDPIAGENYEQPMAGDKFSVSLGNINDIQPLGRLTPNLTEMTLSISQVDSATQSLSGSFRAAWSEDDADDFGEIEGSFDVTGWR